MLEINKDIFDLVTFVITILSFIVSIVVFVYEIRSAKKATIEETRMENIRATLTDLQTLRREHAINNLKIYSGEALDFLIKEYLSDLERFATGVNLNAYDIETINRMSGGTLVFEYRNYTADYISRKRNAHKITSSVKRTNVYIEYETMIKKLYQIRELDWEEPSMLSDEKWVLESFLKCKVTSSDEIFSYFRTCHNVIESHGEGKQGYLYIPGKRKDRCLIVVHADTVRDLAYENSKECNCFVFDEGRYVSSNPNCIIGADDRAGCAIAWLLKDSGHSILVLDGEEHGQIGAHYLEETNPSLFHEINSHTFMIQLDRRGSSDYKCYDLPVCDEFITFIESSTGFKQKKDNGRTDICVLCKNICGVNISVGYGKEHQPEEYLDFNDWMNSYTKVKSMLSKPLIKYQLVQSHSSK